MQSRERIKLMVQVAQLYYEQNMTQDQVAKICQIDRSKVSRLLTQAKENGFVQIKVLDPFAIDNSLNEKLQVKYGLDEAVICDATAVSENEIKRVIGLFAANYLPFVLREDDVLAISWGETIYNTVQSMSVDQQMNLTVVPSVGGSGLISPAYQVNDIVNQMAAALGAEAKNLYAPAFLNSPEIKDELMASKDIQMIMDYWQKATVALVGIGKAPHLYGKQKNSDLQFGEFYLKPNELEQMQKIGVVGDINGRFFNSIGKEQELIVHDRMISMSLSQLQECRKVIGVAGGESKLEAIRAALLGGNLDVLITDSITAMKLL